MKWQNKYSPRLCLFFFFLGGVSTFENFLLWNPINCNVTRIKLHKENRLQYTI